MAVIAILTEPSDFTGEFPITDHAVGVWRLSEAIVAQVESVSFPDAANYGRDLVPVVAFGPLSSQKAASAPSHRAAQASAGSTHRPRDAVCTRGRIP